MAEKSKIEWTEATWSPIVGCSKVSDGCRGCYAEKMAYRLACMGNLKYQEVVLPKGGWNGNVFCDESALDIPLHWRKPRRIFVCSMSDLFHEKVPFEFIDEVMMIISMFPQQHIYQVLTKRPKRMAEYFQQLYDGLTKFHKGESFQWPFKNLHLGVTCENQEWFNERWYGGLAKLKLQMPRLTTFISGEPLLSHIDTYFAVETAIKPDWVIVGCESGPNRRPCKLEWVRSIVEQCKAAGVAVFVKQLELWGTVNPAYRRRLYETEQEAKLHLGEGWKMRSFVVHDINKFPKDLQIRQYAKG